MNNDCQPNRTEKTAGKALAALRRWPWQRLLPLGLSFGGSTLLRGENQVDYRYEYYQEDDHRMKIETHSVYFEQKLLDSLVAKGELVYDSISGATPTGTYRFSPGSGVIRTTEVQDIRRAGNLALDWRQGRNTLTPGFAYSKESDYESYGLSLNDAFEFNEKNTILQLGAAHNFDSVLDSPIGGAPRTWRDKDSTDVMVGVSQLLTPKTILAANFTFGYESGFLSDPYRAAEFVYPLRLAGVIRNENRPGQRTKEIFLTSLTHYFDPLDASIEGSYRFYYDSYGICAQTLGLTWHQWLGKHVILEPAFRFYEQSAASFYSPLFHEDPANLKFYSADYRLSNFYSLDYGLSATFILCDHARFTLGYHRYEMAGLDNTVSAMYPKANIVTIGLSILW